MSIKCVSPVDGRVYAERTAATPAQIDQALQRARAAQPLWREVPLPERAAIIERFCTEFEQRGPRVMGVVHEPLNFAARHFVEGQSDGEVVGARSA